VDAGRLRSVLMIAIFDIGGPLLAYSLLRSAGFSLVTALILSGVLPAAGVIIGISRHRRADAVGIMVLTGIVAGAVIGLISHNAKLVLDEASVPTAVFGLLCLGSLGLSKPVMYRLALEFTGPDTTQGRELVSFWRHHEFRHLFRVITVVWGTAFVAEAAAGIALVQHTTAGTALALSNVLPFPVAGALIAWTVGYGRYHRRKGERLAAAQARGALLDAPDLPDDTTTAHSPASPAHPGEAGE
jgi:hypothetical protein